MNYWPAESANLAETAGPLFDFVDHLVTPGRLAAQRYFGAPGWTMFLNTNAWGYVGPIDWPTAFWQPEASAWLAQHYYEHYLFSRDDNFLKKRAWPVMKGAAEFWLAALHDRSARRQARGVAQLLARARAVHGRRGHVAADRRGPVHEYRRGCATGRRQGVRRSASTARWRNSIAGCASASGASCRNGKLDLDDPKDDHRHVSHLFALHPGRAIDPVEESRAGRRGAQDARCPRRCQHRLEPRLEDQLLGAPARRRPRAQVVGRAAAATARCRISGTTHPPFQIDGNFGATAGMIEMLLQSQNGEIEVLPAKPKAWPQGSISGIRARGDVTVGMSWDGCGIRRTDTGHRCMPDPSPSRAAVVRRANSSRQRPLEGRGRAQNARRAGPAVTTCSRAPPPAPLHAELPAELGLPVSTLP